MRTASAPTPIGSTACSNEAQPTHQTKCRHDSVAPAGFARRLLESHRVRAIEPHERLVVFFPFNGNANDAAGTNHGIVHGATLATDRFGNANQAYSFDGHSDISLSYRAPLQPQSSFTYALWIYVSTNTGGAVIIDRTPQDTLDSIVMLAWQEAPQPGYSFDVRYDDFTYPPNWSVPFGQQRLNAWQHVAMVREYGNALKLYLDGVMVGSGFDNGKSVTAKITKLGQHQGDPPTAGLIGKMDDFRIYDRALSASEIAQLLQLPQLPRITQSPVSQTIDLGSTATLRVTAEGTVTLAYQWLRSGVPVVNSANISGATAPSLTISNAQPQHTGAYSVMITNAEGSTTSMVAVLTVYDGDSDGDGLPNSWEVAFALNPNDPADAQLHPPGDQMTYILKYRFGLNPITLDPDGDGVTDYQELFIYGANPLKTDTDGDGIPDGWEVQHGLNPRFNDVADDLDGDGLSNLAEYNWSLSHTNQLIDPRTKYSTSVSTSDYAVVTGVGTNLFFYDRNDRLVGAEYDRGLVLAYVYDGNDNLTRQVAMMHDANTNSLPDLWEFLNGLTNNANAFTDADGDGWSDWQEWQTGTQPTNTTSTPNLLGNPGTNIATLTLPFTPSNFVVGVGQLDGTGAEEIVIGADGNPGGTTNFLLVLTQGHTNWSTQRVDVGSFGITSIAVGQATNRPGPAIYVGLRGITNGSGRVMEFRSNGSIWQSNVVALSTNQVAFVLGVRGQDVLVSLAATNAMDGSLSAVSFATNWNLSFIDTNRSHRGVGLFAKTSDTNTIVLRLLDRGNILAMNIGGFLGGGLPFGAVYRIESDSWYFLLTSLMSWPVAEANAQTYGGHLVTINSQAENDWLVSQFGTFGVNAPWIGFTDEANEGNFVWSSGEPVTFTNWLPGEPNNESNGDYAVIHFSPTGKWDDGTGLYQGAIVEVSRHQSELAEPPALLRLLHPGLSLATGPVRFDAMNGYSIFYSFADDKNESGDVDEGDDFVTAEYLLSGTNASLLTLSRQRIASPAVAQSYGLASVNFLNSSNDVFFTGEPDGHVFAWTATGATNPLQQQLFSGHHAGEGWHALAAVKTLEPGESLIGLRVDPASLTNCDVIFWAPQSQLPQLASLPNTAPAAAVLPTPNAGGNPASVSIRIWDAEGNASTPFLQYQVAGSSNWSNANITHLDGAGYSPSFKASAAPTGTNHTLVWNTGADLGPGVTTNVLLRVRAHDITLLGEWSASMPYTVQGCSDCDMDGLPNAWELAYGLDAFSGLGTNGASGDFDGDLFNNWSEYIADTNPRDPDSYLRINSITPVPGGARLEWQGGIQATQFLQMRLELGSGAWADIFTNPPPTPQVGAYTNLINTNDVLFYRIRVER